MKRDFRRVVAAAAVASGVVGLSGCTSTGELDFDFNKLAFWKTEMTPEEKARADRMAEVEEQRRIKAELERKVAAEMKAEREAQMRADLEAQIRKEQLGQAAPSQAVTAEERQALAMAELKAKMKRELLQEMEAEKEAKLRAVENARLEAEEIKRAQAAAEAKRLAAETKRKAREFSNLSADEQEAVREIATKYAENFFNSIEDEDYKAFTSTMAPALIKKIDKKQFASFATQVKKTKGEFERFHYMGELKNGIFVTLVFKSEFEQETKKGDVRNESLLRLALGELDDEYLIWSFRLD